MLSSGGPGQYNPNEYGPRCAEAVQKKHDASADRNENGHHADTSVTDTGESVAAGGCRTPQGGPQNVLRSTFGKDVVEITSVGDTFGCTKNIHRTVGEEKRTTSKSSSESTLATSFPTKKQEKCSSSINEKLFQSEYNTANQRYLIVDGSILGYLDMCFANGVHFGSLTTAVFKKNGKVSEEQLRFLARIRLRCITTQSHRNGTHQL